ncbi:hypothetical protein, partial [Vibrio atypicus]|uniref:hypothetical protein n=1 Tax=Vibrio atypicus TaxID=558271 RepID=UPI00373699DA
WPKGSDCKSAGTAFDGSNPSPSTIFKKANSLSWLFSFLLFIFSSLVIRYRLILPLVTELKKPRLGRGIN